MKLLHQTGHNYKWNIQSYKEDRVGEGFILSPLNINYEKLINLDKNIRKLSIFDPQIYLPNDGRSGLSTYHYFPTKMIDVFNTSDFNDLKETIAQKCTSLQVENNFSHIVIPTRYYDREPNNFLDQNLEYFINPFLNEISKNGRLPTLLTLIIDDCKLCDESSRNLILDWVTGIKEIDGIYLIFDFPRNTKQIKDADLLSEAMYFIRCLKQNNFAVYLGYVNTEALLYSLAFPDSITCGSYDNLRGFSIKRFRSDEGGQQQGPKARLYSSVLLQWIEHTYISPIQQLYNNWEEIFSESRYKPLMFTPEFNWHFQKPELYKHYFIELSRQINALPETYEERKTHINSIVNKAIKIYAEIDSSGVYFDQNSDGTHLYHWLTAINLFEKKANERS
jgi:hypothetical protein